jgi:uncharacterized protein (TIGR02611 family)
MFEKVRESWKQFKEAQPGHRFRERYERRQQESKGPFDPGKIINIVAGLAIAALGVIFIPLPGPGSMIIFLGLGLIGCEFAPFARFLDWLEVRVRKVKTWLQNLWQCAPLPAKVALTLFAVSITAAAGFGTYQMFFQSSGN